jgi:hypothetical protein
VSEVTHGEAPATRWSSHSQRDQERHPRTLAQRVRMSKVKRDAASCVWEESAGRLGRGNVGFNARTNAQHHARLIRLIRLIASSERQTLSIDKRGSRGAARYLPSPELPFPRDLALGRPRLATMPKSCQVQQAAAPRCARRVRRRWTKGLKVNTLASRLGFSARTHVAPACGCPVSVGDARTRYARVRAHVRALNGIKSARLIA